jgi:hypothetical protein
MKEGKVSWGVLYFYHASKWKWKWKTADCLGNIMRLAVKMFVRHVMILSSSVFCLLEYSCPGIPSLPQADGKGDYRSSTHTALEL